MFEFRQIKILGKDGLIKLLISKYEEKEPSTDYELNASDDEA
jgi:hypothetical protein